MTTDELHDLIAGDKIAKVRADKGNDAGAARRVTEIAPPVAQSSRHTYLSLARTSGGIGVDATRRLIVSMRAIAAADSLVDEIQYSLRTPPGVDVSDPGVETMLAAFVAAKIEGGVTAEDVAMIGALGKTKQTFTADQVSAAWSRHRPDGKIPE